MLSQELENSGCAPKGTFTYSQPVNNIYTPLFNTVHKQFTGKHIRKMVPCPKGVRVLKRKTWSIFLIMPPCAMLDDTMEGCGQGGGAVGGCLEITWELVAGWHSSLLSWLLLI